MLRVSSILFFIILSGTEIWGQIDITKYFNEDVIPVINATSYPDIEFKWDMPGNVQAYLNTGITELKEENYNVAIENFNEVIQLSSTCWPALYYRAAAHKAISKYDAAEADLKDALSHKTDWQIYEQLGEVYHLKKDLTNAILYYEKTSVHNPKAILPYYHLGTLELSKGNAKRAMRLYERCNENDNKFPAAFVMQGLIKFQKNQKNAGALAYFNKALAIDSTNKEALFWRGMRYTTLNQPEKTLNDWNKLVTYNPGNPFFLMLRGFLHIELEQYDYAFSDLRKAVLANTEQEDKFKGGQTLLDKRIDIQYATSYAMRFSYGLNEEALIFFKKGFCLFLSSKYKDALNEFNSAENIEPSATVHFFQALTSEHMGRHADAFDFYNRTLVLDDDIFDAHKKRAIYRTELKDWNGAYEDFKEMLRIQPDLILTYRLRGLTKINHKDYYGAINDLSKYVSNDSTDAVVWLNRGYAYDEVGDLRRAAEDYARATIYKPNEPIYYELAIKGWFAVGDTLNALNTLNRFIDMFPHRADLVLRKIELLLAQSNWEEGRLLIDEWISRHANTSFIRSDISKAYLLQGIISAHLNKLPAAIIQFRKALHANPNNLEARYQRGQAYLKSGNCKEAVKDFKALRAMGYADSNALYNQLMDQNKR